LNKSDAEETFAIQLAASGLPEPSREYRFHPVRRWRFGFAWPKRVVSSNYGLDGYKLIRIAGDLAVEVHGGQWLSRWGKKSGHHTGVGFQQDIEKYNAAQAWGWTVYTVTPAMVESGEALRIVRYEFGEIAREEIDGTGKRQ
jgi:hypothetical protein